MRREPGHEPKAKGRVPDKERQQASREHRRRAGGMAIGGILSPAAVEALAVVMEREAIPTKMGAIEFALHLAARKTRRKQK